MCWCKTLSMVLMVVSTGACRDDRSEASNELARGKKLFRHHCAACHGVHGRGGPLPSAGEVVVARDLTDPGFQAERSDAELRHALAHGKSRNMPAFEQLLGPEEKDALVLYIRGLGQEQASSSSAALESTNKE